MKITTLALAAVLAMSSSYAFAQAGEGDSNYEGHWTGDGGGAGYSGGYGSYGGYVPVPYVHSYAYEPVVRQPYVGPTRHRRAHSSTSYDY